MILLQFQLKIHLLKKQNINLKSEITYIILGQLLSLLLFQKQLKIIPHCHFDNITKEIFYFDYSQEKNCNQLN